jgi:hypothetical protein
MKLLAAIPLTVVLAVLSLPARADERIEGAVIGTRVSYCEAGKPASCKGTLTLQRDLHGRREMLAIRVPLGTPISCGAGTLLLHRLQGKTVILTEDWEAGERVAKAIEALEGSPSAC